MSESPAKGKPRTNPSVLCAGTVVVLGLTALVGWSAGLPRLTSISLQWSAMQPLSAVSFVIAGLALYLFATGKRCKARLLVLPLAATPAGTLLQSWSGRSLGIGGFPYPGPMAEIVALEFLVFCLFLAWPRRTPKQYRRGGKVATLGLAVALVAVAGYLLGAQDLARVGSLTTMAVPTALGFAFLFTGSLLAQRDHNWLQRLLGSSVGARLARQLLYRIIGWPLGLGLALPFLGHLIRNPRFAFALYIVALTIALIMVILRFARRVDRAESQRRRAAEELGLSRARLEGVVASAMDAIITIDETQRIVLFNAAAEFLFRCPAAEAIGLPIDTFIPERFRNGHGDHVRRFGETRTTRRMMGSMGSLQALRRDGSEFPIEASISQVRIGPQQLFTVILRDITQRQQADEQLRQQATMLDLAPEPILAWEEAAGIRFWNRGCAEIYGFPLAEALGRSAHELLKTVFPESLEACLSALERSGRWSGELQQTARDGRRLVVTSVMLKLDFDGRSMILEANQDITERKRLEKSLNEAKESLERLVAERTTELARSNEALLASNEELQRFAYIASHDLQTPLRTIAGFSQILQKDYSGRLDERADELLGRVVEGTHRMHALIRDLLTYSRVDSQARPFEAVDFNDIFRSVLAILAGPIQESRAEVTKGDLPHVVGDRGQLTQLLQNLVENGIKYHGPEPPRIRVQAERRPADWLFSVKDNGIGIDSRHRESIFEVFRRLHTQQAYPGTGIGLAVCRRVVERHGGRIWVESEPGQGSTFHFTLPFAKEPVKYGRRATDSASRPLSSG